MSQAASPLRVLPDTAPPSAARRPAPSARHPTPIGVLVAAIALAIGLAWIVTTMLGLNAATPAGYWLGVVGGSAMLVVFLYPMRKRMSFMRRWGAAKPWFVAHMVCGIVGPLIVLVHSGFHIGSINAGVAMFCMLTVAASGIVGRFVYIRIHHGLSGAHWTLAELQAAVGASDAQVHSRLAFAPGVEQRLHALHQRLTLPGATALARVGKFMTAALHARVARTRCRRDLVLALKARAAAVGWDRSQYRRALAKSTRLVDDYVDAVQRAAQLAAYERIFSWWHVLHLPLVWLLVLSAVAHVVAVHAY
jgi:hypothetical protein